MKCSHLNCLLAFFACSTSNLFRKTTLAYMHRNMRSHTHSNITPCRANILPPTFMLFLYLPPATSPCRQIQSSPGIFYKCVIASFPSVYKKIKIPPPTTAFLLCLLDTVCLCVCLYIKYLKKYFNLKKGIKCVKN